jgi:hypothetical protein
VKSFKDAKRAALAYPKGVLRRPFRIEFKPRQQVEPPRSLKDYFEGEWTDETRQKYHEILCALQSHLKIEERPRSMAFFAALGISLMWRHVPAFQPMGVPGAKRKDVGTAIKQFREFVIEEFQLQQRIGRKPTDNEVYVAMAKREPLGRTGRKVTPAAIKKRIIRAKALIGDPTRAGKAPSYFAKIASDKNK